MKIYSKFGCFEISNILYLIFRSFQSVEQKYHYNITYKNNLRFQYKKGKNILEYTLWIRYVLRICLQCRRPRFDTWVGKSLWGRKWLPTPVSSPGEFHGQRSLVGYALWGRKESDTTEWLTLVYYMSVLCKLSKRMPNIYNIY